MFASVHQQCWPHKW